MKPTVYIETSVVSYLTARPSTDVRVAAWQSITSDWWESRRSSFEVFVSELVIVEASRGDKEAAARRIQALAGIAELEISDGVKNLAEELLRQGSLPARAALDAFHISVAAVNGMNYLLTWNCTHIANAVMRTKIEDVCREQGFEPPVICTPAELLEGE